MTSLYQIKESSVLDTPVLLFYFQPREGGALRWSTHAVDYNNESYAPRVMKHDAFDMRFAADGISEAGGRVHVTLANADGFFAPMQVVSNWKGGELTVRFAFFDLSTGQATSDSRVLFRGTCSGLDQATESTLRVSFHNRLTIQRATLPSVRVQARCPWQFPADSSQRQVAVDGGIRSRYSPLYACGYSADVIGGVGTIGPTGPYVSCDGSRASCEQRGMFSADASGRATGRFAGCGALEAQFGEQRSTDRGKFVPIVYGTCWIEPPFVFARQNGGVQHYQVLLGEGPIQGVLKVLANRFEIPEHYDGLNAESTGWYRFISPGERNGAFDADLQDASGGHATGPYGSIAYLHIALPASIHSGRTLPKVEVLVDGLLLQRHDLDGTTLGSAFTKNPAWVLLDLLKRIGWNESDIDLPSFAAKALFCDTLIETVTPSGEVVQLPRYRCNLALLEPRSVSEIMRGIHLATGLYIRYLPDGKLALGCEHSLAIQSPTIPEGSNSPSAIAGGWPAYEFGDGTYGLSGIARKANGEPSIRVWSRNAADTPNRASIEFADEFNQYQRDSLSLGDSEDILAVGQEIPVVSKAIGIPNFSQAYRALTKHLLKSTRGNLYVEFDTSVKGIGLSPGDIITVTYLHNGFDRTPFRIIRIAPGLNCSLIHITAQLHDDSWYVEAGGSLPFGTAPVVAGLSTPRPILGSLLVPGGDTEFSITEFSATELDGGESALLSVAYLRPPQTDPSNSDIPKLSHQPTIFSTGGTLTAEDHLYYAISSLDADGNETAISSLVKAVLGSGGNTYRVVLNNLAFPITAVAFHVYRGKNPYQLLRIASSIPLSSSFEDTGLPSIAAVPPDNLFDHANFYWRLEWLPPTNATIYSPSSIGSSVLSLNPGECVGKVVRILSGKGRGQERAIVSNSANTLTVGSRFLVAPDATSVFTVAEASWHFGAATTTNVVTFEVPNRNGVTVQVMGRAASASGQESEPGLSPLGRWTLGGSTGQLGDTAPPPMPYFGLSYNGRGSVDLIGIGFTTLENTTSITSGEIVLHYWNELANPCPYSLTGPLTPTDTILYCTPAMATTAGNLLQVNTEVLIVTQVLSGGAQLEVQRGAFGTTPTTHATNTLVFPLARHTTVVPFSRGFFGSPASGSYHHTIQLPNARIAAAAFTVLNSRGASPVRQQAFTASVDGGIRTHTGGQYTIMVPGFLSLQTAAAPPLVIEESRSVKDVYAVIAEAPSGGPVSLTLKQNGVHYVSLSIPAGAMTSNIVNGSNLPPLQGQAIVTLDVTGVPADGLDTPGRDLTVIIRV